MRRLLATSHHCVTGTVAAFLLLVWSVGVGVADSTAPDVATSSTAAAVTCESQDGAVRQREPSSDGEMSCEAYARTPEEVAQARAYVVDTARPGYTMTLQGAELAVDRLHPEF